MGEACLRGTHEDRSSSPKQPRHSSIGTPVGRSVEIVRFSNRSKPKTQRLRAFTWPDPPRAKRVVDQADMSPRQLERMERQKQERQAIADYQAMIGDRWFPWAGPCLIFDIETLGVERGQAMRFGVCHERGLEYHEVVEIVQSGRSPSQIEIDRLRRKIMFYDPNDLEKNISDIPAALKIMTDYCRLNGYILMTRTEFIRKVFFKRHPIKDEFALPVMVIGHNLPFDLSALAVDYEKAKKRYYGGFTLKYGNKWLPTIQVRKIGASKHMFGISGGGSAKNKEISNRLRFVDTVQLAHGLMGAQTSASMKDLCETFDIQPRKEDVEYDGPITTKFLTYSCNDASVTGLFTRGCAIYTESISAMYIANSELRPILIKYTARPALEKLIYQHSELLHF